MKRIPLLLCLLLLLLLCKASSVAQDTPGDAVRATVPFSFEVNGTMYPAGTYTFRLDNRTGFVGLQSSDRHITFQRYMSLGRTNEDGESRLVFRNENGTMVLHQVWVKGQEHGHDMKHASVENDLE